MRVALAQVVATTDPEANLELIASWARQGQKAGASVVVFPEATMVSFEARVIDHAEPLNGRFAGAVRQLARDLDLTLVVGMFTPGAPTVDHQGRQQARVRNTVLVTGPRGEAAYDKMHVFDAWGFQESRHIEPGATAVVVPWEELPLGLATCYDVRFPALFTHLARHGAEVMVVPASWANGPAKVEQWRSLCVARALDSTSYVVGVGQADPATVGNDVRSGSPSGVGHSLVVSPLGEVLVEAGAAPELLVVDLRASEVREARMALPILENGRFTVSPPPGGHPWPSPPGLDPLR